MNKFYMEENLPPPFPTGIPAFVEDLKTHIPFQPAWNVSCEPEKDALALPEGICVKFAFPDPGNFLATALFDFERFCQEGAIPTRSGCTFLIEEDPALTEEDFILEVTEKAITLRAGTTEGIRRGIYFLMDRISGLKTPFLAPQKHQKHYWMKDRISRCVFGPIKRPPFNRDELMDDIDYYPDEYLSRLAREGINGLWLTVNFRDICKTSFLPVDPNADKRIAKLRKTVAQCLRYGIRTWAFCIEPINWNPQKNPLPEGLEEFAGPGYSAAISSGIGSDSRSFCPRSEKARQYLYDSAYSLFSQVPDLGGMFTISHGERMTSCLSTLPTSSKEYKPKCFRECDWKASDIISNTLEPMAKGIHDAAPNAKLISWLYQPQPEQLANWVFTLPEKLTKNVILAYNFESGVNKLQLGKMRTGGDYWLSCAGPSDRFSRIATAAKGHCGMAAKLQVACSHEVATIPFVPSPGLLYAKYKAMRELGVEHGVLCWYFGNYPGLMNKASGYLASYDFEGSEEEFLAELAESQWPGKGREIAEIWKIYEEAYSSYPLENMFQYYGPMHDGLVWPLHLRYAGRELPRTWKPDYMPAGDAIGEALKSHTLGEASILLERMTSLWHRGTAKLLKLAPLFAGNKEREQDFSLGEALDLHFRSASNILRFYQMRLSLLRGAKDALALLDRMEELCREEAANSRRMAELCEKDSRLGYHSEAEVYKYFPAKLLWRANLMETIMPGEFQEARKALKAGRTFAQFAALADRVVCQCGKLYTTDRMSWKAEMEGEVLHVEVECVDSPAKDAKEEFMKFYIMDEEMITFPHGNIGIARYADEKVDVCNTAILEKQEKNGSWKVDIYLPRSVFFGNSRTLFGIQRVEYVGNTERNTNYPPGKFENELRLQHNYFTPDRLFLLEF